MAKLEKTICGLECCSTGGLCEEKCPYDKVGMMWNECVQALVSDALSLLKAREPKLVHDIAEATLGYKPKVKVGHCPSCGVLISETDKFCRKCGQAVKWE